MNLANDIIIFILQVSNFNAKINGVEVGSS